MSPNLGGEDRVALLRELMEAHGRDVLRMVFSYVRDRHIAEDLSQEVFVKVYGHLDTFRQESSYRTWILRIASNTAKDYLRSSARRVPTVEGFERAAEEGSAEDRAMERQTGRALWDAVLGLPAMYREAIWLFYAQDLSIEEIANVTQSSVSAVKTRLHRGRELLRKAWEGCESHDVTEGSQI